jgi:hypothetical protein
MKAIPKIAGGTALLSLVLLMSGCVVAPRPVYPTYPAYPAYHDHYYQDQGYIMVAPPAPRVEVIGVPPYSGQVWIGGAWFWEGGRHAWHPGHWDAPRPGHSWTPHRWEHDGRSWHFREGRWDKHHH